MCWRPKWTTQSEQAGEGRGSRLGTGTGTIHGTPVTGWASWCCGCRKTVRADFARSYSRRYERSEKALVAVIQEAWIGGVSTRRVDELV